MKFFSFTQISSSLSLCWVAPDDVRDTLEPSHRLSDLYSRLHIQLPKNVAPNISSSMLEIQPAKSVTYAPLVSLLKHSRSPKEDIRHGYEHDLYSQPLLEFEYSHCYISELSNPGFAVEHHPAKQDNDTLLPKPDELISYLHYGSFVDNQP